jgi:rSAM/selenodomain-associated transferase 2
LSSLLGKPWFSWPRLFGLAATLLLVVFLLRKVDASACVDSMQRMRWGWFLLACASYAAAITLSGLRWHVALTCTQAVVHPGASIRSAWTGHFFFVALFGAVGGDVAKSGVYARWYRFNVPEVLAAAPLDRALGIVGPLVLLVVLVAMAGPAGGLTGLRGPALNLSWPWLGAGVGLILLGVAFVWAGRVRGESVWARTLVALREGTRALARPGPAGRGIAVALLAQLALSAVFAFNLQAVSPAPLPWARVSWTFPLITALSCLPFTVAGAGVREIAAVAFLTGYGISAADCVAAAWLTLAQKMALAGLGAAVMWREETVFSRHGHVPLPRSLAAVIPALNEAAALPETLRRVRAVPEITEIIVVDGGSTDGTRAVAEQAGARVLDHRPGRGGQLRAGAAVATADVVLLLHADTWLPAHAGPAALNTFRDAGVVGGGYWKIFHEPPWMMRGARFRCAWRFYTGRRVLGDQAMFIRRDALERIGGVPDMALMEEFELCRKLRRIGRLALAPATVITSARRFRERGVLRTYVRMWLTTLLYRLGAKPETLKRIYERP